MAGPFKEWRRGTRPSAQDENAKASAIEEMGRRNTGFYGAHGEGQDPYTLDKYLIRIVSAGTPANQHGAPIPYGWQLLKDDGSFPTTGIWLQDNTLFEGPDVNGMYWANEIKNQIVPTDGSAVCWAWPSEGGQYLNFEWFPTCKGTVDQYTTLIGYKCLNGQNNYFWQTVTEAYVNGCLVKTRGQTFVQIEGCCICPPITISSSSSAGCTCVICSACPQPVSCVWEINFVGGTDPRGTIPVTYTQDCNWQSADGGIVLQAVNGQWEVVELSPIPPGCVVSQIPGIGPVAEQWLLTSSSGVFSGGSGNCVCQNYNAVVLTKVPGVNVWESADGVVVMDIQTIPGPNNSQVPYAFAEFVGGSGACGFGGLMYDSSTDPNNFDTCNGSILQLVNPAIANEQAGLCQGYPTAMMLTPMTPCCTGDGNKTYTFANWNCCAQNTTTDQETGTTIIASPVYTCCVASSSSSGSSTLCVVCPCAGIGGLPGGGGGTATANVSSQWTVQLVDNSTGATVVLTLVTYFMTDPYGECFFQSADEKTFLILGSLGVTVSFSLPLTIPIPPNVFNCCGVTVYTLGKYTVTLTPLNPCCIVVSSSSSSSGSFSGSGSTTGQQWWCTTSGCVQSATQPPGFIGGPYPDQQTCLNSCKWWCVPNQDGTISCVRSATAPVGQIGGPYPDQNACLTSCGYYCVYSPGPTGYSCIRAGVRPQNYISGPWPDLQTCNDNCPAWWCVFILGEGVKCLFATKTELVNTPGLVILDGPFTNDSDCERVCSTTPRCWCVFTQTSPGQGFKQCVCLPYAQANQSPNTVIAFVGNCPCPPNCVALKCPTPFWCVYTPGLGSHCIQADRVSAPDLYVDGPFPTDKLCLQKCQPAYFWCLNCAGVLNCYGPWTLAQVVAYAGATGCAIVSRWDTQALCLLNCNIPSGSGSSSSGSAGPVCQYYCLLLDVGGSGGPLWDVVCVYGYLDQNGYFYSCNGLSYGIPDVDYVVVLGPFADELPCNLFCTCKYYCILNSLPNPLPGVPLGYSCILMVAENVGDGGYWECGTGQFLGTPGGLYTWSIVGGPYKNPIDCVRNCPPAASSSGSSSGSGTVGIQGCCCPNLPPTLNFIAVTSLGTCDGVLVFSGNCTWTGGCELWAGGIQFDPNCVHGCADASVFDNLGEGYIMASCSCSPGQFFWQGSSTGSGGVSITIFS
jgi:hypothetical protein